MPLIMSTRIVPEELTITKKKKIGTSTDAKKWKPGHSIGKIVYSYNQFGKQSNNYSKGYIPLPYGPTILVLSIYKEKK